MANQLGEWIGQAKRMTRVMRRQLEEEFDLSDPLDQTSSNFPPEDTARPQFINNSPDNNDRPEEPDSISSSESAEPSKENNS